MAKCIQKDKQVKRVSDNEAHTLVHKDQWKYISKSEWRRLTCQTVDENPQTPRPKLKGENS